MPRGVILRHPFIKPSLPVFRIRLSDHFDFKPRKLADNRCGAV